MIDIQKFIAGIHGYLAEQLSPLVKRVAELEANKPQDGKDGAPGQDGKSVDVAEVESIVQRAVSAIPVPSNGTDGKSVPIEDVERMVSEAVSKAMASVQMPKDGAPGRDGAHLEILPAISEEKEYPRGTYAKHRGGLWRAYEQTNGLKGWECIVDGVADIKVEGEERNFTVTATKSSGLSEVKNFTLPVLLYRGVFKEGEEYAPGDTVTWGGSLWHCDESTDSKPGELASKGWKLMAKRGRDGKDGVNGKDLTKGVELQ